TAASAASTPCCSRRWASGRRDGTQSLAVPARLSLVAAIDKSTAGRALGAAAPAAVALVVPAVAAIAEAGDRRDPAGHRRLAARPHGDHRQLARRLLRHRAGRTPGLSRRAAEPRRRAGA